MSDTSSNNFLTERNGEQILKHSTRRRILELVFMLIFLAVGVMAIVFGAIFTDQSNFFRIALIILGCIIALIYLESFISIMLNKIIVSSEGIKLRSFFRWNVVSWVEIESFEAERKGTKPTKEGMDTRYSSMQINTVSGEQILFPIFRFRPQEAEIIIAVIKETYKQTQSKRLLEEVVKPKSPDPPITNEEIEKQIPPKVNENEIEVD